MTSSNVDRGWAWVILFASFCGMVLNGLIFFSTGVIMDAMLDEVDPNLTQVSWIGSVHTASMCCSGLVAGVVITRYGCRTAAFFGAGLNLVGMTASYVSKGSALLILTYSVLGGSGCGFGTNASYVSCAYYFKKYRAIASGIVACGSGFGLFIGPPIVRMLIDIYTLHGTFLLLGGFATNYFVLGMLMRQSPIELENRKPLPRSSKEDMSSRTYCLKIKATISEVCVMFKNFAFVVYLISSGLWAMGDTAAIFHMPNYAQHKGTSTMNSAVLLTVMGAANLPSRLLVGFAATDPSIGPEILHIGLLGLSGLLTILFPLYSNTFETQILYTAGYGLYSGGIVSLFNPILADIVSVQKLANGYGLCSAAIGIGALVGAPIAGMIVDGGGKYEYSYVFAGASLLLGSFISAPIALHRKDDQLQSQLSTELELSVSPEKEPLQHQGNKAATSIEIELSTADLSASEERPLRPPDSSDENINVSTS